METISQQQFSSFSKRFFAFLIDRFVLWFALIFIANKMHGYDFELWNFSYLFSKDTFLIEVLILLYFVLCETSSWQATLGKKVMGIRIVSTQFQKIEMKEAIIRYLSKYLSMAILMLGFIWIIFDDKKQSWHDKIADTYVIE